MQAIFSNVHRECNVRNDAAQAGAGMMMWFISSSAFANEIRFNMTRGATAISQQVYDLHMTIFYICCVIGLLVFGILDNAMNMLGISSYIQILLKGSVIVGIIWMDCFYQKRRRELV